MRSDREKLQDVCLDCMDYIKNKKVNCDKCPIKWLLERLKGK